MTAVRPAAVLSAASPTVVKLQLHHLGRTGTIVGSYSAIGTTGAIFGSFVTGFVLAFIAKFWNDLFDIIYEFKRWLRGKANARDRLLGHHAGHILGGTPWRMQAGNLPAGVGNAQSGDRNLGRIDSLLHQIHNEKKDHDSGE